MANSTPLASLLTAASAMPAPPELPSRAKIPLAAGDPAAPPPSTVSPLALTAGALPAASSAIPRPDYMNAKSRLNYSANVVHKYGPDFHDTGDTFLNVNEIPRGGSDTMKNISTKAAKQYGIDPGLLYSSAMGEGATGLFKSRATGLDTRGRKPGDYGYQDNFGDKDYPINGANSFGLNTITQHLPELVKGGYLHKDFAKNLRGDSNAGQYAGSNFKNVESAMQAKAAMLKEGQDTVDKFAQSKGIALSPKAREFFMLAAYNGGEGAVYKRMQEYQRQGLLENDKFLQSRPKGEEGVKGTVRDVWGHVAPRLKMRDALKSEQYFQ